MEEILSVRVARRVAADHTVSWQAQRWGLRRENVCAGLRGARVEIERRLGGSHWLRFRRYLPLQPCPAAPRSATPSGLRPAGLADQKPKPPTKIKTKRIPSPDHPWRKPWKRTFLLCVDSQKSPPIESRVRAAASPSFPQRSQAAAPPQAGHLWEGGGTPHASDRPDLDDQAADC